MLNTMAFSKKYTPMNLLLLFVIHFADSLIQNITGGVYLQNRYVDTNVIRAIKDIGPKMCVEDCMFYSGCDAVNYRPSQLTCELLNGAYPYNQTTYRSGMYFTKLEGWTREANQCWPNPCSPRTKCVPAYNNQHVCTTFDTPCDVAPCQNDGTCRNEVDSYRCVCPSGYYGSVCQYTPCTGKSCYNGGTCQISGSSWYCQCPSGYKGSQCQNDPCSYSDCDGTCTVVGSQWKCCTDGFWRSSATCVYGYG